jgi:proteasome lid subunit RPN8/RPN11
LILPTDLIIAAWRTLFPAERMMWLAGRRDAQGRTIVTSFRDITGGERSSVHVKASPVLLQETLLDWEATGAHLVGWIHSHPGRGPLASHPSAIDRRQDEDLRATYGLHVVGLIVTQDGILRIWGEAATSAPSAIRFEGRGVQEVKAPHV